MTADPNRSVTLPAPFAAAARLQPYWWERTPRPHLPAATPPERCDVAIIGSGYTGLHAAIQTARAGRSTVVFDAEDAGFGCSARNGGQVSTSVKPTLAMLARRHGTDRAQAILGEGRRSLSWLGEFIGAENIDCDFGVVGRYHAAHNPAQFSAMARRVEAMTGGADPEARIVTRAEQHREIDTDAYHGGVVYTRHASLDPARYHQGLLQRALDAGVQVIPHCAVTGLQRDGAETQVRTARGQVRARDVVVDTNGYTGALTPWLRRRVIPIGSYMIATEPMPVERVRALIRNNRIVSDTRKVVYYYRASPDQTRIVFGGRVSVMETDPRISGPILQTFLHSVTSV